MAILPGLGEALEGLIKGFTATSQFSAFGAAQHPSGLPGGNVIQGRPEVATNARALTRILGGGTGTAEQPTATQPLSAVQRAMQGPSPVSVGAAAASIQRGTQPGQPSGPLKVEMTPGGVRNLALEIGKQTKPQASGGGRPSATAPGGFMGMLGALFGKKQAPAMSKAEQLKAGDTPLPGWMKGAGKVDILHDRRMEEFRQRRVEEGAQGESPMSAGVRNMRAVQAGETFGNVPSEKGWSSLIKSPGAPPTNPLNLMPGTRGGIPTAAKAELGAGETAIGAQVTGSMAAKAAQAGEALGTFAGKAIPVVGVVTTLGAAAIGTAKAMYGFAEATVEGNKHLAKWNGQLAVAAARAEIGAIRREQHMAAATGGSATMAQEQFSALNEELQPAFEDLATIKNLVATGVASLLRGTAWLAKFDGVLNFIHSLLGAIEKNTEKESNVAMEGLLAFLTTREELNQARNPQAVHGARAVRPGGGGQGGGMGPAAAMTMGQRRILNAEHRAHDAVEAHLQKPAAQRVAHG